MDGTARIACERHAYRAALGWGKHVRISDGRWLRASTRVGAICGLLACPLGSPAGAETLREALSAAYKFNPRLDAARATLRAVDEEVPRALAGYRPSVPGSADS